MMRMLVFITAAVLMDVVANGILVNGPRRNFAPRSNNTYNICTDFDALMYSHEFHNCFVDRKYQDGAKDLENIVDRVLKHSSVCIGNVSRNCRPDYKGFMVIMEKVVFQMKDYTELYLESIYHGRGKIKDLDCVETSLSNETYAKCFKEQLGKDTPPSEEEFQRDVEKAISCTNKSLKPCSIAAKTSLNRLVRTVLKVQQREKEDIEEEKPPEKPWRWYDYITYPFVWVWNKIKSFFSWF